LWKPTCYYRTAINKYETQIYSGNCQFIPVVNKEVELNPLLSIIRKGCEFFEYKQNNAHRQNDEYAKSDEQQIQRLWQRSTEWTTAPGRAINHLYVQSVD